MGDLSASDCSWKKLVLAKSNDRWFTTLLKPGSSDSIQSTMNTANFSISEDSYNVIKQEKDSFSVDLNNDEDSDGSVPMLQIDDPLLLQTKKKRRKSLGPKNETPEERSARLAKMSAYAAKRLANETPEQRAIRLKRMSDYAAKRLSQETSEQRARRLARMSAYAARRLASETPEQRQARLTRMSAYAARRQAMKRITHIPKLDSTQRSSVNANYDATDNVTQNQS